MMLKYQHFRHIGSSMYHIYYVGWYSSIGLATRYQLDSPVIEFRCGKCFPHLSRPALGPIQPPTQWVPGVSRG